MTDNRGRRHTEKAGKHDTRQDTQKAAGNLQGRTHRRQDGTSHGDEDTAGDTRQPRNTRHGRNRRSGEQAEGREEREGHGWPRAWGVVEGSREEHGSREGTGREQTDREKDMIYIFKGEKREKRR